MCLAIRHDRATSLCRRWLAMGKDYQKRVEEWLTECFSAEV
jgi:hypothetical protein